MKQLNLKNLSQNSLFLPTTRCRQFEFPAAQYLLTSKQLVENLQKFSFFYSESEKSWIKYQIQTQSETKWQEEVPFRKKIVFFQVKISCHILIWHENQPLVLLIVTNPTNFFSYWNPGKKILGYEVQTCKKMIHIFKWIF